MKTPHVVEVEYEGEVVSVKPDHELFMRIEDKVSFSRVAQHVGNVARGGNAEDIPMAHVSWIVFCALRHGGASVRDVGQVHVNVVNGKVSYGHLLGGLIMAYYGATPEKLPKKEGPAAETTATNAP